MAISDTSQAGSGLRMVSATADGVTIVFDEDEPMGFADPTRNAVTLVDDAENIYARADDGDPVDGALIKVERDGAITVAVDGVLDFTAGDNDDCLNGKIVGADDASSDPGRVREAAAVGVAFNQANLQEQANAAHRIVVGNTDNGTVTIALGG